MIEIRRILCPIDFSDFSRRALDHAVAIARWYGATITALHVFSPAPLAGPGPVAFEPMTLTPADRDQLVAETKAFAASESAPGVQIDALVREGGPAYEIVAEASRMRADLIVVGTHGRSGFERLLLGSVAERVLRKATCPVMTVPRRHPDAVAISPVFYKRILCPIDFSSSSMHALKYAISMAQEADGQLTVVHVVEPGFPKTGEVEGVSYDAGLTIGEFLKAREDALARRLHEVVAGAPEFCTMDSLMARGDPPREVLRIAQKKQSDLIVIGVHGRGAADLLFFGSTTQHVVREAVCPVLTIRSVESRSQTSTPPVPHVIV